MNASSHPGGHVGEQVCALGLGIDVIELGSTDQGIDQGCAFAFGLSSAIPTTGLCHGTASCKGTQSRGLISAGTACRSPDLVQAHVLDRDAEVMDQQANPAPSFVDAKRTEGLSMLVRGGQLLG